MLPGGTAYMSDAGMTGDYDSVIGMQKEEPLQRFMTGIPSSVRRPSPARSAEQVPSSSVSTATPLSVATPRRVQSGRGDAGYEACSGSSWPTAES